VTAAAQHVLVAVLQAVAFLQAVSTAFQGVSC
jgi:hypothetical protein